MRLRAPLFGLALAASVALVPASPASAAATPASAPLVTEAGAASGCVATAEAPVRTRQAGHALVLAEVRNVCDAQAAERFDRSRFEFALHVVRADGSLQTLVPRGTVASTVGPVGSGAAGTQVDCVSGRQRYLARWWVKVKDGIDDPQPARAVVAARATLPCP